MAITAISRDWGVSPSIVRIVTSDNLSTITTTGYLITQQSNIEALQAGDFEWESTDYILISYSGGEGFFTRNPSTQAFVSTAVSSPGALVFTKTVLSPSDIIGMNASPVLLVPSAGFGKVIFVERVVYSATAVTTNYTGGGNIFASSHFGLIPMSATVPSTTVNPAAFTFMSSAVGVGTDAATQVNYDNNSIALTNDTGPFAGGDNTLTVYTWYYVLTL